MTRLLSQSRLDSHATSSIEWSNLECRLRTRSGCESRRLRGLSAVSWVHAPTPPRIALIGDAAIGDYCLRRLLEAGFQVVACLPGSNSFAAKARSRGVPVMALDADLEGLLETPCDWILSIFNIRILPEKILAHPSRGVINFHDGPLPRYAGLYAPTRALLDGETEHGVTWHLVDREIDTGDLLVSESVPIDPEDTSLSLQLRCVEAGCESFERLIPLLHRDRLEGRPQDSSRRTVFGNRNWSRRGLETDWSAPRESTLRVVRGHFFGPHANYVGRPRFRIDGRWHALIDAKACWDSNCSNAEAMPGTTRMADDGRLHVRCGDGCLVVMRSDPPVSDAATSPVDVWTPEQLEATESWDRSRFRHELEWRRRLIQVGSKASTGQPGESSRIVLGSGDEDLACGLLAYQGMYGRDAIEFSLAWRRADLEIDLEAGIDPSVVDLLHPFAPVRFALTPKTRLDEAAHGIFEAIGEARRKGPFLRDLLDRDALVQGSLPDPASLPVRLFEGKADVDADTDWMFERDEQGAWLVTGPRAEMDSFADLVTHRRRTLIAEPTTCVASLPRVAGATASKILSWEGSTSIATPPSFLEIIVTRLRARDPHMVFVESAVDGGATDAEMAVMVESWAEVLGDAGIGVGDLVAVRLDRGTPFVAAMFAVLGLGATFVPIDPLAPESRVLEILKVLDARVGIAEASAKAIGDAIRWISAAPKRSASSDFLDSISRSDSDRVAFVLFTSGSTGRPKGIRLTHRNFDQYFETVADCIHPEAYRRSSWTSSVAFDSSIAEIVFPLLYGGVIVAFERSDLASIPAFVEACASKGITGVGCATALWSAWMKFASSLPNPIPETIRHVDIGGSAADPEHVKTWLRLARPDQCLVNRYGPTETTETVTAHRIESDSVLSGELPVGRPERGTEIRILDSRRRRVPPGQEGEIWVGGGQVALGYLGMPEPNDWFQAPPDADGRWYRTGDRAIWRDDGEILFRGRADDQVKVGGYRVELGEIHTAIQEMANGVEFEVLAIATDVGRELAVLVKWPESADGDLEASDSEAWRSRVERELESRLPRYAIPRRWRFVATLPRTPSGKVDRTIASKLLTAEEDVVGSTDEPGTRGWIIAEVGRALGRRDIDVSRSFFELGGDSLSAMGLHAALESANQGSIPITLVHVSRDIDDLVNRYRDAIRIGSEQPVSSGHRCEVINEKDDSPEVMFMPGIHGEATLRLLWASLGVDMSISAINLDLDRCRAAHARDEAVGAFDACIEEIADLVLSRPGKALPVMVGYSIGGWIAFGVARECLRRGVRLPTPILIEPEFHVSLSGMDGLRQRARMFCDSMVNLDPIRQRIKCWRARGGDSAESNARDPRGRLPDDVDREFRRVLVRSLLRHKPRPADVEIRLVTRRSRHHRFAGWSRLARGGVRYERVDFREHKDFFRFGSERVLLDLIRRHVLATHVAGGSSL